MENSEKRSQRSLKIGDEKAFFDAIKARYSGFSLCLPKINVHSHKEREQKANKVANLWHYQTLFI